MKKEEMSSKKGLLVTLRISIKSYQNTDTVHIYFKYLLIGLCDMLRSVLLLSKNLNDL